MTMWLKQSTAATIKLGPFVDATDGVTAETALTISQADIRLSKNGGAFAQTNNAAGATHDEAGEYGIPLDATDTNTLGRLKVRVSESGALPVWQTFMVVPANVWDSFFGADKLQTHVDEMTAGIITATVIATDAIDNDAIAANAVTELQSGLATAASVATLQTSVNDLPTNAELDAVVAPLATAAALAVVDDLLDTEIGTLVTNVAAILADTGTDGVVVAAASKSGYALASTGLDAVAITAPAGVASNFREMVVQVWRRYFKKSTLTETQLKTYADNGSTVLTTQAVSDDLAVQTLDSAT